MWDLYFIQIGSRKYSAVTDPDEVVAKQISTGCEYVRWKTDLAKYTESKQSNVWGASQGSYFLFKLFALSVNLRHVRVRGEGTRPWNSSLEWVMLVVILQWRLHQCEIFLSLLTSGLAILNVFVFGAIALQTHNLGSKLVGSLLFWKPSRSNFG